MVVSCVSDPAAVERLVFELLEQLRVESLAPEEWPGARANLHARFVHWSQAFADSGLTESSLGILLFTVAAQQRQHEINGVNRSYFCGAYWRYGFHEDGVVSALAALKHFEQAQHAQRPLSRVA